MNISSTRQFTEDKDFDPSYVQLRKTKKTKTNIMQYAMLELYSEVIY